METQKALGILIVFAMSVVLPSSLAQPHTFVQKKGGAVEAEIVDASSGVVTLLADGKTFKSYVTDFSDADQVLIRDWMKKNRGLYDWSSERGAFSDGSTDEAVGEVRPSVLWRAQVGEGDAALVSAGGHLVATGVRGGQFVVVSLNGETGSEKWKCVYPCRPEDGRATAAAAVSAEEGKVFTMGPMGRLDAWKLEDGENIWATELAVKFPDAILSVGGDYGSPVFGGKTGLMVEVGGPTASMVSFSRSNGAAAWRVGKHRSLGATPVLATVFKQDVVVSRNDYGIVGREVETGRMAWDYAWEGKGRAAPLVLDEGRVFVVGDKVSAMFQTDGKRTAKLWETEQLCHAVASPVHHEGFLYGFHGEELVCMQAESGKVVWSQPAMGAGGLIRAAGQLLIQTGTSGELVIAEANPKAYVEKLRIKVFEGASRTLPVLASGRIYCRSVRGDVTCLDLRAKPEDR